MHRYPEAEALERHLGDPNDPERPLSFARSCRLDEAEAAPEESYAALDAWGFNAWYVPGRWGGRLDDAAAALALLRVGQRRDVTVAHQYGNCLLGGLPVWISGSDRQKRAMAERLLRGERVAFALSERAHGGDIVGSETSARAVPGGYVLTGEKWPISQATRATALSVLARTGKAGPRGFSWFYVEKDQLAPDRFGHLERSRTLGLRGADISGIRFHECFVPRDALAGVLGEGMETALRGLLLSKAMVATLPLGATDTALRVTTEFAETRRVLGARVADIPHARTTLAGAFVDLLVADCVATVGARSFNIVPEQASLHGNVVKAFVPGVCKRALHDIAGILGARFYLRDEPASGIFQKMLRDTAIVDVFDGSTLVCLNAIGSQLAVRASRLAGGACDGGAVERARLLFSASPVPPLEPDRVALYGKGRDDVVDVLPHLLAETERAGAATAVIEALRRAREEMARWPAELDAIREGYGPSAGRSAALYEVAEEYCVVYALCACVGLWLMRREDADSFFARGDWVVEAARRLGERLGGAARRTDPPRDTTGAVFEELCRRARDAEMFSVVPVALGRRGR